MVQRPSNAAHAQMEVAEQTFLASTPLLTHVLTFLKQLVYVQIINDPPPAFLLLQLGTIFSGPKQKTLYSVILIDCKEHCRP